MRTPKVNLPAEDPADKAARQAEQQRAENARTEEDQAFLMASTAARRRRFGAAPVGATPIYGAPGGGSVETGGATSGAEARLISKLAKFDRFQPTLY